MPSDQVLLIDDDELMAFAVTRALQPMAVTAVHNGDDGLTAIADASYGLVLVDMSLGPGGSGRWRSGIRLAREILLRRPELEGRVVLFTGYGADDPRVLESGLPALPKDPLGLGGLKNHVEAFLSGQP